MNLKNKTILLTGATGGIGSALAKQLTKEGANLMLVSKENGFDLTKKGEVEKLIDDIKNKYDQLDLIINCAGVGVYKSLTEITLEEWEYSFKLNVEAQFLLIQGLLSLLQKSPESLLLTIGSGAGVIPMKNRSLYCATKFALRGFILSLAEEFEGKKPKFCLITLGSTLTNFAGIPVEVKMKKFKEGSAYFTPEWVAEKLVEIIKDNNRQTEIVLYPGDFGFGTWKKPT